MSRFLITACCVGAAFVGSPTHAAPDWNVQRAHAATVFADHQASQPGPENLPPSPAESMKVYQKVDAWVRAWSVPDAISDTEFPTIAGACVVLRLHGELLGRGIDTTADTRTVWRATREAMEQAGRRMPVENDALRDETIKQLVSDVTLSVELAGPLVPIKAGTFEEAAGQINPGLDGVACRLGTRSAAIFPSSMITGAVTPRMALSSVVSQAGEDATLGLQELQALTDKNGATFYRFRVVQISQLAASGAPAFVYRGGRVVNLSEVGTGELRAMADRIAEHILARSFVSEDLMGLRGVYDPARDTFEPAVASPIEQLGACYALLSYARLVGPSTPRGREILAFVDRITATLQRTEPPQTPAWDDPTVAACWVAVAARRREFGIAESPLCPEPCKRNTLLAYSLEKGFPENVPPAAHALVALALVELAGQETQGGMRDEAVMLAESAVRRIYRTLNQGELVGSMPWLGWAEVRLAQVKNVNPDPKGPPPELPAAVALRQMRRLVWEHQVAGSDPACKDAPGTGGPDMLGGIVFDAGSRGQALPTWQCARPLAFLATALGDDRLTSSTERSLELAKLLNSLRFLRQLETDASEGWMLQNKRRALGGIRSAPWDPRMPTDAQTFTLLTIAETLRSLGLMAGR